jgi:hypothetical protein
LWVFIPLAVLEIVFHLWKARFSPPRVILTSARVGPYRGCMHIYIPPYAVPPTTLIPRSRIPGLQGSQGHRVTGSPKPQSHRTTEPQSHGDARSQDHQISKYPSSQESWGHRVTRATLSHGHWVIGSLGHWVIGLLGYLSHAFISMAQVSRVSMVTGLPRFSGHMIIR